MSIGKKAQATGAAWSVPDLSAPVDSALFVAATGGLDVDAIPNEITTSILVDSSKSSILAQAINISARGVR